MKNCYEYSTALGRFRITATEEAVTAISLTAAESLGQSAGEVAVAETPLIRRAAVQLGEYLAGERSEFDLPLAPEGTPFQHRVWEVLKTIPYGQTRTYGEVAAAVGNPKASRAVGMANNRNPLVIVVPCHRVIGAGGQLTGYACGLGAKEFLLDLERRHVPQ